ncbi:hypothetical protein MMC12_002553 [Toensbergia leucococca]|nr:hypothetical protein [Toensbergia leucococca]
MGRALKFSFPLPGWKAKTDKSPTADVHWLGEDAARSPNFNPGSKLERLLGPSDIAFPDSTRSETNSVKSDRSKKRDLKKLQKKPSFMSVTVSEVESDSARESYGGAFALAEPVVEVLQPSQGLRNQPSSPLLGKGFPDDLAEWASVTDVPTTRLRPSNSSSTMQSYYDAGKSPLSVSQQTSASSARDMALRKGFPAVSSPLSQDVSQAGSAVGDGGYVLDAQCGSPVNRRRRPPKMDFAALFPKPRNPIRTLLSPDKVMNSPSELSMVSSNYPTPSSTRPKWLGADRKRSKDSSSTYSPSPQQTPGSQFSIDSSFQHVVIPANVGGQNSFEGHKIPEVRDLQPDLLKGHQVVDRYERVPHYAVEENLGDVNNTHRKSNNSVQSQQTSSSTRTVSFKLSPLPPQRTYSHSSPSLQSWEARSNHGSSTWQSDWSRKGSGDVFSRTDLQQQSILELSSSDDESEEGTLSGSKIPKYQIRDSIEKPDRGDEVLILNAERVTPVKPGPIVNVSSRMTPRSSRPQGKVGNELSPCIPNISQPPKRGSSMRWQQFATRSTSTQLATKTPPRGDQPLFEHFPSSSSSKSPQKPPLQGGRLMTVTVEEEKLLEAMRQKRASMRQILFSDFESATSPRPKTAGLEGRSTFFESDKSSLSSHPSGSNGHRKSSLRQSPHAASTEDLSREDSFPFYDASSTLNPPISFLPAPKLSPTLSLGLSETVPSPPTSRDSPATPPPGDPSTVNYAGDFREVARPFSAVGKGRGEGGRTGGSGLVLLGGVEHKIEDLEVEQEGQEWPVNRWR